MRDFTRRSPRAALFLCACVGIALLSGCATMGDWQHRQTLFGPVTPQAAPAAAWSAPAEIPTVYRTPEEARAALDDREKAVIASAETFLGQKPNAIVSVKGKKFMLDCIGTVSAIYYGVGVDVQIDFRRYSGDGVSRLYQSLRALNVLHRDRYPRPGDIIFWDNTWDANGDGDLTDDPLTHAGIVMAVDDDGTIHYVHEHVVRGVVIEAMNLLHPRDYYAPDGRIVNSAMAMNSGISRHDNPAHWTSGDLWDSFGDILRARDHYAVAAVDALTGDTVAMRPAAPPQ